MNDPRHTDDDETDPLDPLDLLDEAALDRELAESDELLANELRRLLDPDQDLGARTANDVGRALRSRSTLGAALDLIGTGWWTARALLTDDHTGPSLTEQGDPADGEPEGT